MASITINASAGGGWYGSVTTTDQDSEADCEEACKRLERLLAARTSRPRPRAEPGSEVAHAPGASLRDTLLARLATGPIQRATLLAGLSKKGPQALRDLLSVGEAHVAEDNTYRSGPSPQRA